MVLGSYFLTEVDFIIFDRTVQCWDLCSEIVDMQKFERYEYSNTVISVHWINWFLFIGI